MQMAASMSPHWNCHSGPVEIEIEKTEDVHILHISNEPPKYIISRRPT